VGAAGSLRPAAADDAQQRQLPLGPRGSKPAQLVAALQRRYVGDATQYKRRKGELNAAYADAMRNVTMAFPEDHHIATLFADALMNISPWDYWSAPRPSSGAPLSPLLPLSPRLRLCGCDCAGHVAGSRAGRHWGKL
jgi:hypothetical protein